MTNFQVSCLMGFIWIHKLIISLAREQKLVVLYLFCLSYTSYIFVIKHKFLKTNHPWRVISLAENPLGYDYFLIISRARRFYRHTQKPQIKTQQFIFKKLYKTLLIWSWGVVDPGGYKTRKEASRELPMAIFAKKNYFQTSVTVTIPFSSWTGSWVL